MPFNPNDTINPGCGQTITWGPMPVWTNGTTVPIFHPATDWMPAGDVINVRRCVAMRGDSGNIDIAVSYQVADNPDSPSSTVYVVDSYQSANGEAWGSSFTDISSVTTAKQYIRFGIAAKNSTGSHKEAAQAWFRIDIDAR